MRVLWVSNSPWTTSGYGQQTAEFVPRLIAAGYETAIAVNYGFQGGMSSWRGIPIYPQGYELYSNDIIPSHAADWLAGDWQAEGPGDGWIFTLFDTYTFQNNRYQRFNIASWCPVDHLPAPADVVNFFRDHNAVPIAMSRFGEDMLQRAGLDTLYVPHGIDTTVFSPGDKALAREVVGLPGDAFVVTMNAANKAGEQDRKSFKASLNAFGRLVRRHSDALLFVHAEQTPHASGLNLPEVVAAYGIPEDRVRFIDPYMHRMGLPQSFLADIYRASDVLLAPSKGEGFGIPVIEAQACGTPVIVSDFSAQPELIGDGWKVAGDLEYHPAQHAHWFSPHVGSIEQALEEAYEARSSVPSVAARAKALEYDADRVWVEHFLPALKVLEARTPTLDPIKVGALR